MTPSPSPRTLAGARIVLALVVGALGAACGSSSAPNSAHVTFVTDADFCGAMFIERYIDGTMVGRDTMKSRTPSGVFTVSSGSHVLGARRVMTFGGTTSYFTWPDTTVAVGAGVTVTRTLALYCS